MKLLLIWIISWYYYVYLSDKLLSIFVDACNVHINSSPFNNSEKEDLKKRVAIFSKKYKSVELIQYSRVFVLCDDINYITVQVSTHDLEILAFRLIELRFQKQFLESIFFAVVIIACC